MMYDESFLEFRKKLTKEVKKKFKFIPSSKVKFEGDCKIIDIDVPYYVSSPTISVIEEEGEKVSYEVPMELINIEFEKFYEDIDFQIEKIIKRLKELNKNKTQFVLLKEKEIGVEAIFSYVPNLYDFETKKMMCKLVFALNEPLE